MKEDISRRQCQFFVFLLFCLARSNVFGDDCAWNLNADVPKRDPLYITDQNSLVIPDSRGLALRNGDGMLLMCSGPNNVIEKLGIPSIRGVCYSNNKLLINWQAYTLKELECKNFISHKLTRPNSKCANANGDVLNLGFNSISLVAVCYNTMKESNLYSYHILHGKAIKESRKGKGDFSFRSDGLKNPRETPEQYKKIAQKARFADLFGSQSHLYINEKSFLARGHLAPVADFLLESWCSASFYFVNAAPQWQVINNGNWLKVEEMTRKIADIRQESLSIYTGTHGVLQLPNENDNLVAIYLSTNNELPVPKYFWKLIYSPTRKEGIVLITLNNPFLSRVFEGDIFCPNICEETKWNRNEWTRIEKGYTFCCSVDTFIRVVRTLPRLEIRGNMEGPSTRSISFLNFDPFIKLPVDKIIFNLFF